MEFIDDYRLLAVLRETQSEPLSLALINTEGGAEVTHMKTIFFLPPFIDSYQFIDLLLECGAHEPSPAESLAPFHQDPSQRIVVLDLGNAPYYLVLRAEALLAFENRAGPNIRWDAWKGCVVMPLFFFFFFGCWFIVLRQGVPMLHITLLRDVARRGGVIGS